MTRDVLHEQSMEKQMGCMSGFLQIFDRHHLLNGKRIYATKRLSSSPSGESTPRSEKSDESPAFYKEEEKQMQKQPEEKNRVQPVPECAKPLPEKPAQIEITAKLPVIEFKEGFKSSWKFRESPRLSLDSRASVDGKGSLYPKEIRTNAAFLSATRCESTDDENEKIRSPSVIARLMGLEVLPEAAREPRKKPELRRSASESRSRDLLRFGEAKREVPVLEDQRVWKYKSEPPVKVQNGGGFVAKSQYHQYQYQYQYQYQHQNQQQYQNQQQQMQRKSYFDSEDFFPEPKQSGSLYGEIEKRLKMRGIDEPEKDLEALKQILEALQLKGLLRAKKSSERNIVFDRPEDSPIVVMKPKAPISRRIASNSPPPRSKPRNLNFTGETLSPVRARRDRPDVARTPQNRVRNSISPDRSSERNANARSPRGRERKGNDAVEQPQQRKNSPVNSPRMNTNTRRTGSGSNRSPRNSIRSMAEISQKQRFPCPMEDESSSISECSYSTMDTERSKTDEGRNLLARCDKLLYSIAEITNTESQPSPVSVLDSSFYHEESSPSPVMKRCIDFKDHQSIELADEDDKCSQVISPVRLKSDDSDFVYVSEILQAACNNNLPEESDDLFFWLERQRYKSNSSNASRLHRKLVFDTVLEILDKKKQLAPWKLVSSTRTGKPWFRQIWLEFCKVRERKNVPGDLFEVICGVLEKDMAGDSGHGWGDCGSVTSQVVLDIERLIFKDLVGETIRDLAAYSGERMPRRKLIFE